LKSSTALSDIPRAARWGETLANYGATVAVIAAAVWFYTRAGGYHRNELSSELQIASPGGMMAIRTPDLLVWLAGLYALVLLPYYAVLPGTVSKARVAFTYVLGQFFATERPRFGRDEQQAFLALALKVFFVPLMLNWLLGLTTDVLGCWRGLASSAPGNSFITAFNTFLYLLVFKLLLMIDVLFFTVGYVIEIPALRNEIRTVDPTLSGWVVCLACYPPFNQAFSAFFPWQASDFPKFADAGVHVLLNCAILVSMAVYASASVALGLRASNLTNRGIVANGPYACVRHPAYMAKNLAWWIGALPAVWLSFTQSLGTGLWALTSVIAWTTIYALRALTEERHLLMLNNGYAEYMAKVRWRFIPKVC
jgi:protein-S-isoprenylcysteine O-methyltransferase Ste14